VTELGTSRVAVYLDFDNIVISRYDQLHGRNAFQKDRAAGFHKRPGRLAEATVDVGAIIDFASSFGTLVLTRAYADWSADVNAAYQDQLVARLPALSPAERALDEVATAAASTIDSIIAAVDGSRTPPAQMANPPIPTAALPAAQVQPMPAPVQSAPAPQVAVAATQPAAAPTATAGPPATDAALVMQIQRGLASLGFFHAAIDGKPGPETARAIREFENFHRYRITGQVQPDLVGLLREAGATI